MTEKVLALASTTMVVVVGSFAVNRINGSGGIDNVALAWNPQPADSSGASNAKRQTTNDVCDKANPSAASLEKPAIALDVRGSIGVKVWATGLFADVCTANLDREVPDTDVEHRVPLNMPVVAGGSSETFTGIQVLSSSMRHQLITVVIGRGDVLPNDCINLDVNTPMGIAQVMRVSDIFAFWYPGSPPASGMTANSIHYTCRAGNSVNHLDDSTSQSFAVSDLSSKLCFATIDVLAHHGIVNQDGLVADLDKWDMTVNEEFERRVWPIVAKFTAPGAIYQSWSWLNQGELLALEASGAKKLQNRNETEADVAKSIDRFIQLCNHSLDPPSALAGPVPPTTTSAVAE